MKYRLITTRPDGEQRAIDYATRAAAFNHFSAVANMRNVAVASIMKRSPAALDEDMLGVRWEEIAHMEVTRQAQPQRQAEAEHYAFPEVWPNNFAPAEPER